MKSLTGLSAKGFLNIAPVFRGAFFDSVGKYKTFLTAENSTQQRRHDERSEEFSWIKNEKYEREKANRKRKIGSVKEFLEIFPEAKDIFIDGTERPIRRPKDNEAQRNNYSGKKKRHTKKDIVICDRNKKIGFLGKTTQGKEHDFTILKSEEVLGHVPKDVVAYCDLGFQGIQTEFPDVQSVLPQKKPRGKELSADEKEQNRTKSRIRILVENALAGIKRLRIVSDIFRNRVKDFDDPVMLICSGLWNYHLV